MQIQEKQKLYLVKMKKLPYYRTKDVDLKCSFADVFIVFAKIEEDKYTFILEKGAKGMTMGEEEHKLGLPLLLSNLLMK